MNARTSGLLFGVAVALSLVSAVLAWREAEARDRAARSGRLFSFPSRQVKSLQAQLEALARLTAAMIAEVELNVRPVFDAALAEACQALGADMAALHLGDDERGLTRLVAGHQLDPLWARAWAGCSARRCWGPSCVWGP